MARSVTQRERRRGQQLPVVRWLTAGCVAAGVGAAVMLTTPGLAYADGSSEASAGSVAHNTAHSSSTNPKAAAASRPRTATRPNRSTFGSASSVKVGGSRSATGQAVATAGRSTVGSAFRAPAVTAQTAAVSAVAMGQVTPVITGMATAGKGVLDAAINCLSNLPGPISEFVQGALIVLRRNLFPVSTSVGLDYGTAFASPAPTDTAALKIMYQQGVTRIRMYDIVPGTLSLIKTEIPGAIVSVGIPNYLVAQLASDPSYAATVLQTLQPYNSIVKTIVVGNEVDAAFPTDLSTVATAVANMQNAIAAENLSTAVTVSFTMGLIANSYPPSASILNPSLTGLTQLLGQLKDSVEIDPYPLIDLQSNPTDISLAYALGLPSSTPVIDNGVVYHSLFWAEYDGVRWALDKAGITLPIYVGETGWATSSVDGQSPYSTVANAKIYNQNIIDSILTGGSPKFGVEGFPFNLFEFSDENQKPGGLFEPYWGWYSVGSGGALTQKYSLNL
jgi:exo-beta-1,3-glucanase (GH17 family)